MPLTAIEKLLEKLAEEIPQLRRSVDELAGKVRRGRLVAVCVGLLFGLVLGGGAYVLHENTIGVDQLACAIVAGTPNNARQPIIADFRARYGCPAYGHDPNFKLYPKPRRHRRHR